MYSLISRHGKNRLRSPICVSIHFACYCLFYLHVKINQAIDFLMKTIMDVYVHVPRQANNYTIKQIGDSFILRPRQNRHNEIVICQSSRFVRGTARRKTVFCTAKQFKDSHQSVFSCHFVNFEFTGWV